MADMVKKVVARMRLINIDMDLFDDMQGVTKGKIYDVIAMPKPGEIDDITFIDDNGQERKMWNTFLNQ